MGARMKPSPLRGVSKDERRWAGVTGTLMGGFAEAKTPVVDDRRARERVVSGSMVVSIVNKEEGVEQMFNGPER